MSWECWMTASVLQEVRGVGVGLSRATTSRPEPHITWAVLASHGL